MSELSVQQRIDRGRRAAELLESDVFHDAVEKAKRRAIAGFLASDRYDAEKASTAWAVAHSLDLITEELRRTLSDGQIAAATKG